jgi:hypothetical protein
MLSNFLIFGVPNRSSGLDSIHTNHVFGRMVFLGSSHTFGRSFVQSERPSCAVQPQLNIDSIPKLIHWWYEYHASSSILNVYTWTRDWFELVHSLCLPILTSQCYSQLKSCDGFKHQQQDQVEVSAATCQIWQGSWVNTALFYQKECTPSY